LATPAIAWDQKLSHKIKCDRSTGTWTVTWKLVNEWPDDSAHVVNVKYTPTTTTFTSDSEDGAIAAFGKPGDTITATQTGLANGETATLKVTLVYDHDATQRQYVKYDKVIAGTDCEKTGGTTPPPVPAPPPAPSPSPSPTPSPSVSPTRSPSVSPTPSSSPTVVPPPPAPPAAPTLPKTGSSTLVYGLGALALGSAGAALYLIARRRRIKFIA
jgi:LPXTG-motif cell wall-anchored protein